MAEGEEGGLQGWEDLQQAGDGRQQEQPGHPGRVEQPPVLPLGKLQEVLERFGTDGTDRDVGVNLPDEELQVHLQAVRPVLDTVAEEVRGAVGGDEDPFQQLLQARCLSRTLGAAPQPPQYGTGALAYNGHAPLPHPVTLYGLPCQRGGTGGQLTQQGLHTHHPALHATPLPVEIADLDGEGGPRLAGAQGHPAIGDTAQRVHPTVQHKGGQHLVQPRLRLDLQAQDI